MTYLSFKIWIQIAHGWVIEQSVQAEKIGWKKLS